jgi:hypothetical protein
VFPRLRAFERAALYFISLCLGSRCDSSPVPPLSDRFAFSRPARGRGVCWWSMMNALKSFWGRCRNSVPRRRPVEELRQHVENSLVKLASEMSFPNKLPRRRITSKPPQSRRPQPCAKASRRAANAVTIRNEIPGATSPGEIVPVRTMIRSWAVRARTTTPAAWRRCWLGQIRRPKTGRTLRFVAFVNEEPPLHDRQMGASSVRGIVVSAAITSPC